MVSVFGLAMWTPVVRGREDSGCFLAYTRADAAFQEDSFELIHLAMTAHAD
jgi:hypothetical protein